MAKTRQQKEATLQDLTVRLEAAKALIFANVQKLKMKELDELRHTCREQNLSLLVSKKTLLKRALANRGITVDIESFAGGISTLFGVNDEMSPAQIIAAFTKTHPGVDIFGGVFEGSFIDSSRVQALAKLPGKKQLLGQLVYTLGAPMSGLANVLAGNLRGLITALTAIKEKKPV